MSTRPPRSLARLRRLLRVLAAALAGTVLVRVGKRVLATGRSARDAARGAGTTPLNATRAAAADAASAAPPDATRAVTPPEARTVTPDEAPATSRVASPDRAPALFSRRATRMLLAAAGVIVVLAAGSLGFAMTWVRTPYSTGQYAVVAQPVPFSHQLHVTGFEIECRYCHYTVDRASTAGMPDTRTCVPCHNETWLEGPWFEPVRRSLATGRPIPWRRVNDLPDHVFFDHAIHVRRAIPCATCHGDVAQMPVVYQTAPLTMQWCLECHMEPTRWLRPLPGSTVQRTAGAEWSAPSAAPERLEVAVQRLTTCTACHR